MKLHFNHAGNAEMTDLFKCERKSVSCCAPKAAIQKLLQEEQAQKQRPQTFLPPPGLVTHSQQQPPNLISPPHVPHQQGFDNPYVTGYGDYEQPARRPYRPLPPVQQQNLAPWQQQRIPPVQNGFLLRNDTYFPQRELTLVPGPHIYQLLYGGGDMGLVHEI
jgi:hypothetical protein